MEQSGQASDGPVQAAAKQTSKSRHDLSIKLAFLLFTLVAVALIYSKQRSGLKLPGWGEDLSAALSQAATENRPVLAFFVSSPPGETERRLKGVMEKPGNVQAIEKGRFIKVAIKVGSVAKSEPARRFGVMSLPTMLVIGPDGVEKNRREGFIGEVDFRTGFLEGGEVIGPASSTRPR